jgi:hypothetical protein
MRTRSRRIPPALTAAAWKTMSPIFILNNSTITGNKAKIRGGGVDKTNVVTYSHIGNTIYNKAKYNPDIYP